MPESHQFKQLMSALNVAVEPFATEAAVFYAGGGRKELLEQLEHLCRYGPPLVVLLGEQGVGKTTLLDQLDKKIDPSIYRWVRLDADSLSDQRYLYDALGEGFALDLGQTEVQASQVLLRFATELDSFSQTPLIVMDAAQQLSAAAAAALASLLSSLENTGLRCLLAADGDALADVPVLAPLEHAAVNRQIVQVPKLSALASQEYLNYRLVCSGLTGFQFSDAHKDMLFQQSQGNIDKLNIAARQILAQDQQARFKQQEKERQKQVETKKMTVKKFPIIHAVILAVILTVLCLGAWFYYFDAADQQLAADSVEPPSLAGVVVSNKGSLDINEQALVSESTPPPTQPEKPQYSGEVDLNYAETDETFLQPVAKPQLAQQKPQLEKKPDVAPKVVSPKQSRPQPEQPQVSAPALPKIKPTQTKPAKPAVKPAVKTAVAVAQSAAFSNREKRLLSLNKSHFTLQMLGARNESAVRKFIARYPALKDLVYYKTRYKKGDWYVVVLGDFVSRKAAKERLAKLPAALQNARPWVRSIASVQNDIRARSK